MTIKEPKNKNYCATVVRVNKLLPLDGCDNIVSAIIFNNSVIVSKSTEVGTLGLYFPPETQLSKEFLYNNNLYRNPELNKDVTKSGYFEENGRIKIAKFKGHKSEGLFMPINCVDYISTKHVNWEDSEGTEFDEIDGKLICNKYIPKNQKELGQPNKKADKKVVKRFDRLVENQFRLHQDTLQLRKNIHKIKPDDFISITNKLHGTSWVVGKVLTRKPLGKLKSLLKKIIPELNDTTYDLVYSSRAVVKNKYINKESNGGFYGYDLWKDIADTLKENIMSGITLYGEAVGYLPNGKWIQKGYHYGSKPNNYSIYIYRITYTNVDGKVIEFSWPQIKNYCNKFGLTYVPELYYGKAKDYCPEIPLNDHWNENFLAKLEKDFILDRMCPLNNNEVPEEGIVIKVDNLFECEPFKLKNFKFLLKETKDLDKGEIDLETEQSLV